MRYLIGFSCIALIAFFSFRTTGEILIKGKITDAHSGAPLEGVSVRIKGTIKGSISAYDGSYTINIPAENTFIEFVFAGYTTVHKKATSKSVPLHIIMHAANTKVAKDEAVVAGYSTTQERKSIAASAPSVRAKQITRTTGRYAEHEDLSLFNTEAYDGITENRFREASVIPLSTFSIDVDAASYSNVRRFLQMGQLPPAGAVRIEEMINYFPYEYPQPKGEDPFSIHTEIAECPWNPEHRIAMIGLQGKKIPVEHLPASNLVFLIDVSGSMMDANKLPLVRSSMKLLVNQLREKDRVAIVVYAGNAGLVLPSTRGSQKQMIGNAIDALEAGGSTAGGQGIRLAYQVAKENFIQGANNRVILCTDGDFNVGASSDADLEKMIEQERESGVYLTVLGYGMGNYKDSKMQRLAGKGNGNHAYIDHLQEARKVLVNEFGGTLFTIAKDVKLQVEFNPATVQGYRLIGYENRILNKEDFNNDKKDAGDLGSGHTVTALYEIIPVGVKSAFIEKTDALKYQRQEKYVSSAGNEMMTVKFRYKAPDGDSSKLIVHTVKNNAATIAATSDNFRFAVAVAQFGMLLTNSEFKQGSSFSNVQLLAKGAVGKDEEGYRHELIRLLQSARELTVARANQE